MGDIRCKECNELNDRNAFKCESCKTSLSDVSEVDECEHDYRFIEEAELKGEIYKLEIVEDENCFLGDIPVERANLGFKLEKEANTVSKIEENAQMSIESGLDRKEVLETESKNMKRPLTIEPSEIAFPAASYQCEECSKSFKRKASLKAHFTRIHNADRMGKAIDDSIASEMKTKSVFNSMSISSSTFSESCDSDYEPPEEDTQYTTRGKQLKSALKVKRILEQNSDESDSENNNSKKKSATRCKTKSSASQTLLDLKQNIPNLRGHMVYKCTACEKISKNYEEHIKHIIIHDAPVDILTETTSLEKLKKAPSGFLKCKECEEVFMTDRDYKTHEKMHKMPKIFQCEICDGILATPSSLRKHTKRMHKIDLTRKVKHYDCTICNEKFPAQILLIHHRKTHMDVIKKIEEMTVIDRGGEKPIYVCKICAKTSKSKFRHEEHLRIHTKEKPFKCEQCGTRISTTNAMAHHLRLHENDRPFNCNICKATYRHKKSLKKHLIVHTGERPFKCHYCEKTYAFNYTRASHERSCHIGDATSRKRRRRIFEASEVEVPKDASVKEGTIETRSKNS